MKRHMLNFTNLPPWLWMVGKRLGLAVARRLKAFGTKGRYLGFGSLKRGLKRGIGMQARNSRSSHETPFDHIAVPMDVTDDPAFSKGPTAGQYRQAVGKHLRLQVSR